MNVYSQPHFPPSQVTLFLGLQLINNFTLIPHFTHHMSTSTCICHSLSSCSSYNSPASVTTFPVLITRVKALRTSLWDTGHFPAPERSGREEQDEANAGLHPGASISSPAMCLLYRKNQLRGEQSFCPLLHETIFEVGTIKFHLHVLRNYERKMVFPTEKASQL